MSAIIIWITAVLAFALLWWGLRRKPAALPAKARQADPASATAQRAAAQPWGQPGNSGQVLTPRPSDFHDKSQATTAPLPADLAALVWLCPRDLDAGRQEQLLQAIRGIPRPPHSLQQLLSPDFVAKTDSTQLSELVMAEPLIAAKVLGSVNSPRYGLHKPISHLGQAVTFLGMNTVRSICLQYMLAEAFKPGLASAQKAFDAIWESCGLAGELAVRLGKAMNLPQQGALATQVVLGFVGPLAAASLLPAGSLQRWMEADRVGRTALEQELLGLNACEIGRLLLESWSLPASLVDEVCDSGRVLVMPARDVDTTRVPLLGLASLCSHLSEHPEHALVAAEADLMAALSARSDTFHLHSYLSHPALAHLPAALITPQVQACLSQDTESADEPV